MAKYAKRGRFFISLAAALMALTGMFALTSTMQQASAVPPLPQAVSGTATVNGAPAPASAVITVQIGGVTCPTNPATVNPSGANPSTYFLAIVYGDPQAPGAICTAPGPTTFFINGLQAGSPVSFTTNPQFNVNISAGEGDPTPTSTTAPPTATSTTAPPTATSTTAPPTATNTTVPPTATNTTVPPTATSTTVPPASNTVQFSPAAYSALETAGSVTLTVTRTGSVGNVSVDYATSNLTATAGSDYTAASGTLTWNHGDTASKTIVVTILNDSVVDPGEQFRVTLSNPTCQELEALRQVCVTSIGGTNPATVTITDDEIPPTQVIPTATATLQGSFIPPAAFTPSPTATATPTQTPTSTPVPPTPTRPPATATAVPATATAVAPTATIPAPRPPATGTGTASTEVSWFMIVGAVFLMVAGTAIVARRTTK